MFPSPNGVRPLTQKGFIADCGIVLFPSPNGVRPLTRREKIMAIYRTHLFPSPTGVKPLTPDEFEMLLKGRNSLFPSPNGVKPLTLCDEEYVQYC